MHKSRYKPFYKQFLRLRKNVQDRPKLLRFSRQKWSKLQQQLKNQLKFYRRFKIKDQFQLSVLKFASRGNSFQRRYRNLLHEKKIFGLSYGNLKKDLIKKHVSRSLNYNSPRSSNIDPRSRLLYRLESRLDTVLYRAGFSNSIREATQIILHGHILVNQHPIRIKSYTLKNNDLIEVQPSEKARRLVRENLLASNFWPIPPKHLSINYKTLQILFHYSSDSSQIPVLSSYINLNSVIAEIRRY